MIYETREQLEAANHARKARKEINEGIDGSGRAVWLVLTYNDADRCVGMERFHNPKEAQAWLKWA